MFTSSGSEAPPKVSVALCTWNGERFLREQLESIVTQTQPPDQLVVCDDGSSDGTRELLEHFWKSAPFPVKLHFNQQRLGVARNFEQALSQCNGEFVALCDQDDRWHPRKLEALSSLLGKHPNAGFACSNAELIDARSVLLPGKLWEQWRIHPGLMNGQADDERAAHLLRANCVTGATMMIRWKGLASFLKPIPESWVHDHWTVVICEILGMPGIASSECLTQYRQHSAQTLGLNQRGWFSASRTCQERRKMYERRDQQYRDLEQHLWTTVIPQHSSASRWLDILHMAGAELSRKQHELADPWWMRSWNRWFSRAG